MGLSPILCQFIASGHEKLKDVETNLVLLFFGEAEK